MLWIDPEKRHKLGRRATLCEAFLGISPGGFSDKIRVMVAGFIPDGEAMKNKNIKIGDWLRSINSREVTSDNLEYILAEITTPTTIKLELQRVAGVEVTTEVPPSTIPKQSPLVRRLVDKEASTKLMESLLDYSFGVIYLQTSGLSETGPELQGVMYTYPRSESKNHSILCTARGAFITLNHMLPDTTGSQPVSTTVSVGSEEIHVLYSPRGDELLLLAIPGRWYSLEESLELVTDITRTLEFSYQSLNRCFSKEENHQTLDHLFCLIFTSLLNVRSLDDSSIDGPLQLPLETRGSCQFEGIISAAQMINLPRDAQIQIDAALNEMEAMDYRDWNEDPMDCQRLYTIVGSCLYHKSYLLASHLPKDDLIDVHSFLRQNGVLNLVENESTKSLVLWRSVYPASCGRGVQEGDDCVQVPESKWFLLVVGFGSELLAAVLETGGCTAQPEDNQGPDVFYVEEAQETLKHIQKIGISTLAAKWISANARPETVDIQERRNVKTSSSIAENLLGLIKPPESVSGPKVYASPVGGKKIQEVTSILKKRSPEQSPVMSGSVYSLQTSEDSMSQGTGAVSEMSDEAAPILGRRATRERHLAASRQSDDSDSDVEMYRVRKHDFSEILAFKVAQQFYKT